MNRLLNCYGDYVKQNLTSPDNRTLAVYNNARYELGELLLNQYVELIVDREKKEIQWIVLGHDLPDLSQNPPEQQTKTPEEKAQAKQLATQIYCFWHDNPLADEKGLIPAMNGDRGLYNARQPLNKEAEHNLKVWQLFLSDDFDAAFEEEKKFRHHNNKNRLMSNIPQKQYRITHHRLLLRRMAAMIHQRLRL